ncbi:MAG: tetratricopeptide repeat protein [Parachlamydia sp.]|nr:tetratricopeptide repeat protein [Parachlamydia sp.]
MKPLPKAMPQKSDSLVSRVWLDTTPMTWKQRGDFYYYSSGNRVKAIACFEEALAIFKDNEDHRRVEHILTSLNTVKLVDKKDVIITTYNEGTFLLERKLSDEEPCCCLLS